MPAEFEKLIQIHSGRIRAIASRYAEGEGVEDLYQEILEQLWRSFGNFRSESRPETWIYRVGFNTAMTSLRKKVKQRRGDENLQTNGFSQAPTPQQRSDAEILSEFINSLGEVDTSILMMYLDGLSGQEMADALGMNLNAVHVRISRLKTTFTNQYIEVI